MGVEEDVDGGGAAVSDLAWYTHCCGKRSPLRQPAQHVLR